MTLKIREFLVNFSDITQKLSHKQRQLFINYEGIEIQWNLILEDDEFFGYNNC